jgi:ubiquinone biosynthesis protein UbiJ
MPDPLTALGEWMLPAATARFILLANHVLAAAPAATERLRAHSGRLVRVELAGWQLPFAPPPPLLLQISPAGLFESPGPDSVEGPPATPADLRLQVDVSRPLDSARRLAAGDMPSVQIEGDAGLATDMNWLITHVRWDIAADLERVFGPVVAGGLGQAGERAVAGVRALVQGAADMLRRG